MIEQMIERAKRLIESEPEQTLAEYELFSLLEQMQQELKSANADIDKDKVFNAFRNCITVPKCRDCSWESCERFDNPKVEIPVDLALDVLNLLKERIKHE